MGEPLDLNAYIDSLGPMAPEQRALVDDAMALVQHDNSTPAFLRDAALYPPPSCLSVVSPPFR